LPLKEISGRSLHRVMPYTNITLGFIPMVTRSREVTPVHNDCNSLFLEITKKKPLGP
jgi:hypothetical protein